MKGGKKMASQADVLEGGQVDSARAAAFGERMVGVVNDACLALMTSVGHRSRGWYLRPRAGGGRPFDGPRPLVETEF